MWAGRYGIGFFEDRRARGINYNLTIEVGGMLVMGRRLALLRDARSSAYRPTSSGRSTRAWTSMIKTRPRKRFTFGSGMTFSSELAPGARDERGPANQTLEHSRQGSVPIERTV